MDKLILRHICDLELPCTPWNWFQHPLGVLAPQV